MPTATSKITSKYQATIPEPVRKVLHLKAGDSIAFDIEDNQIRIRKARPIDFSLAKALEQTLSEWDSATDEEAYRNL